MFTAIFLLEAMMRVISDGLVLDQDSYLRNGWNIIDATVVVAGLVELSFQTMNLKSLRVIRIFRPLKSINTVKSVKNLILALIKSIPDFANVVVFLIFMFLLFATFGLHQYNGSFYNACRLSPEPESPYSWTADVTDQRLCSTSGQGMYQCPTGLYCMNPKDNSTYNIEFEKFEDRTFINYGITNFNNIGASLLTVFQIVMSDTWYQQMSNMMDVENPYLGGIYCVIMILIGQFFLLNLILAVIIFSFIKSEKEHFAAEIKAFKLEEEQRLMEEENMKKLEEKTAVNALIENTQIKVRKSPIRQKSSKKILPSQKLTDKSLSSFFNQSQDKLNKSSNLGNSANIQKQQKVQDFTSMNDLSSLNKQIIDPIKAQSLRSNFHRSNSLKVNKGDKDQIKSQNQNLQFNQANDEQTLNIFLREKAKQRKVVNVKEQIQEWQENENQANNQIKNPVQARVPPKYKKSTNSALPFKSLQPLEILTNDIEKIQIPDFIQLKSNSKVTNQSADKSPKGSGVLNTVQSREDSKSVFSESNSTNKQLQQKEERGKKLENKSIFNKEEQKNDDFLNLAQLNVVQGTLVDQNPFIANSFSQVVNQIKDQQNQPKQEEGGKTPVFQNEQQPLFEVEGLIPVKKKSIGHSSKAMSINSFTGVVSSTTQGEIEAHSVLEKKIDQEFTNYFKTILNEANENLQNDKSNMREVVGIKLSLEFIKKQQLFRQQDNQKKAIINERIKSNIIYKFSNIIQESFLFRAFIVFSIIINTIVLSLDKYPQDQDLNNVLEKLNLLFAGIFAVEMLLRLLSIGFKLYFKGHWFNFFDALIVISSFIDITISEVLIDERSKIKNSGSVFTALRAFRLLRVFKLAKSWKRFQLLLETMGHTLKDVASFSVLLLLFIFILTLLGMELFANQMKLHPVTNSVDFQNGISPDVNFDTFINAFSAVFIILTNDGTSGIYYNLYRSVSSYTSTIYIIIMILIGQKVILNLFIAILLQNFDEGALRQKMYQFEEKKQQKGFMQQAKFRLMRCRLGLAKMRLRMEKNSFLRIFVISLCCRTKQELKILYSENKKKDVVLHLGLMQGEKDRRDLKERLKGNSNCAELSIEYAFQLDNIGVNDKPLYIIPIDSGFRRFTTRLLRNIYFDQFIISIIFLNCVQLALDNPFVDPDSQFAIILSWIDIGTTIIFIIEAFMKILSFGFAYNGPSSYIKNTWNRLDFAIIILSLLSTSVLNQDFKAFKVLRVLRLIGRNEGLKIAVKSLFMGLPNILNVAVIMFLFFLIFGVIAVSQFKGRLFTCQDADENQEIFHKWDCLNAGGEWVNDFYNFDNVPNAIFTFFVMSTTAGWSEVMTSSITSNEIDYVAGAERNLFWNLFFIFFLIIGFFFFLNLFIGVVVSNFNTEKDKIGGNDLLTEKQREWIDLKLLVLRCDPIKKFKAPENSLRLLFFKIQDTKFFKNLVFWSIFVNSLILMFTYYGQPKQLTDTLEILNYIFTMIFVLEALIKIIGRGIIVYMRDGWNIFSFVIAFVSAFGILISVYNPSAIKGSITFLRSFRILRILRLLRKGGRSLRMIFNTFVITFHQLANIGTLLMILIYMYSVLGMILLGTTARNGIMNTQINFENFFNAFLTLFTVTTADSWNAILTSFAVENSILTQCKRDATYQDFIEAGLITVGCGNSGLAIFYFTSFYFIVCLIFLQLFIAIILQGYDQTQIQETRVFNDSLTQQFRKTWAIFDPDATTFIYLYQLRGFLSQLGAPLGFEKTFQGNRLLQDKFIASMDLPTYYDFSKYQFLDVLDALSFRMMIINQAQEANNQMESDGGNLDKKERQQNNDENEPSSPSFIALKVKGQISKVINSIIQKQNNEHLTQLQLKKRRPKEKSKDQLELTSVHHIAAEATIRKIKRLILRKRQDQYNKDNQLIPPNVSILKRNRSVINLRNKPSLDELLMTLKAPIKKDKKDKLQKQVDNQESKQQENKLNQPPIAILPIIKPIMMKSTNRSISAKNVLVFNQFKSQKKITTT